MGVMAGLLPLAGQSRAYLDGEDSTATGAQ